ncbi:MAG: hypothetical protein ACP5H2_02270 [Solirubrobacteraceae bacterium]
MKRSAAGLTLWLLALVGGVTTMPTTARADETHPSVRPLADSRVRPLAYNPSVQLSGISCATAGNCTVAGVFQDALGDTQVMFTNELAGRWGPALTAQPPAGAASDPFSSAAGDGLAGITCPGNGSCVAVGTFLDRQAIDRAVAFSENQGRWHRGVTLMLPRSAVHSAGKRGQVTRAVSLYAVSCASQGNCVAVGSYETTAQVWEGLIVSESGGHWGRGVQAPLPAGAPIAGQDAAMLEVTCANSSACTISGDYLNADGHQEALLISGHGVGWLGATGNVWSAVATPAAPADANVSPTVTPTGLSCPDANDCAAVGTYVNPFDNSLGVLLSENAGTWSNASGVPLPPGAAPAGTVGDQAAVLAAVSCPLAGGCAAVGWYFDNYENGQGLLVNEVDGIWQPAAELTLPPNALSGLEQQSAGLDSVSCPAANDCLATGVYTDLADNSEGLLATERDGIWLQAQESPLPGNAATTQTAATDQADCTTVGNCAVVGEYYDTHGSLLGFRLDQTNGVWQTAVALPVSGPTATELKLSLQAILTPQGPAGKRAAVLAHDGFRYTYRAVTAGLAVIRWFVRTGHRLALVATGRVTVAGVGEHSLNTVLTRAGRQLLAGGATPSLWGVASFTAHGRHLPAQHATAVFHLG